MQFFGHVKIDGATGQMTVTLRDRADVALWSTTLDPEADVVRLMRPKPSCQSRPHQGEESAAVKLHRLLIAGALWLAGMTMRRLRNRRSETRAALPAQIARTPSILPYGKALLAELGKSLRKQCRCLLVCTAKGIAPDQLEQRGHDLIVKWGLRMMETANSFDRSQDLPSKNSRPPPGLAPRDELSRLRTIRT